MCSPLLFSRFSRCRPGKRHFTWAVGAGLWRRMAAKNGTKQPFPSTVWKTYTLSEVKLWEPKTQRQASKSIFHWFLNLCPNPALWALWVASWALFAHSPLYISFSSCVCFCRYYLYFYVLWSIADSLRKLKQSMQLLLPTRWNSGKQKASFANVLYFIFFSFFRWIPVPICHIRRNIVSAKYLENEILSTCFCSFNYFVEWDVIFK